MGSLLNLLVIGGVEVGSAVCNYCDFVGPHEPRRVAQDRAVWHVYKVHPDLWADIPGLGSVPKSPRPEGPIS